MFAPPPPSVRSISPAYFNFNNSCPNVGCGVQVRFNAKKEHLATCEHRTLPCFYADAGCTKGIKAMHMTNHKRECPCRPTDCPYREHGCESTVSANKVELHAERCPFRIVTCPSDGKPPSTRVPSSAFFYSPT